MQFAQARCEIATLLDIPLMIADSFIRIIGSEVLVLELLLFVYP